MANTYTIMPGDTLSGIGSRFGLNWNDLAKWNNIANPNMIYAGRTLNLSAPQAAVAPAAPAPYEPPKPNPITPFSQILDMNKVFPTTTINSMVDDLIRPGIERQQSADLYDLNRGFASSGGYRSGYAPFAQKRVMDSYSQALEDQRSYYSNQIQNWLNDWYNQQYTNYYNNPSAYVMPTLPTFDEFMQNNSALASAYNNYNK